MEQRKSYFELIRVKLKMATKEQGKWYLCVWKKEKKNIYLGHIEGSVYY